MILGNINQIGDEIKILPRAIQSAMDFLVKTDFSKLENKTYPIQGDKMFVTVAEYILPRPKPIKTRTAPKIY